MRRSARVLLAAIFVAATARSVCGYDGHDRSQAPPVAQDVVLDRLVATVNGDVVTASDVRAARLLRLVPGAATMTQAALVDALVNRRLILSEVARFAPAEPSAEAVAAARRQWEAGLPPGAGVPALLVRAGVTDERLTAWLRDDLRISAYLDQRFAAAAQPTRDETQQYFQRHQADYAAGGIVPPFANVQAQVRQRLAAERRAALVQDWVQELRDRADIQIIGGD